MIKYPPEPTVFICAELLVKLDTDIQVVRVLVLLIFEIIVFRKIGHDNRQVMITNVPRPRCSQSP